MNPQYRKRILLAAAAVVVLALIVWSFLPKPVPVETATVSRGPLQLVVEEEGETRVADRYAVTAPTAGILRRIELEEGDVVASGQPLLTLDPPRPLLLDQRSRSEAAARLRATEVTAQQAETELRRIERLAAGGAATRQALEQAGAAAARARAELEAARAALAGAGSGGPQAETRTLRAPAAGRVLAVRRRSEGPVNPGDTLVVIGDTGRLEVRADVLSQDAVRIRPGTRVLVEQWGGEQALEARVVRIEPQAHTVVSSLGVEEQRVTVIAALEGGKALPAGLGSGYRVLARFVIWEGGDVLQVPASALFRRGDGWAAFVVSDRRAELRDVQVGQQAGLSAQVLGGLAAGDQVIVHPASEVTAGTRVAPRRD
jgi:HlyD family secretion protein